MNGYQGIGFNLGIFLMKAVLLEEKWPKEVGLFVLIPAGSLIVLTKPLQLSPFEFLAASNPMKRYPCEICSRLLFLVSEDFKPCFFILNY